MQQCARVACLYTDSELDLIHDQSVRCGRVFLTYVLTAPITEADVAFIRDRLLESLGAGYRVETDLEPQGAWFRVFDARGARIRNEIMQPHGMPAPPRA